MPIALKLADHLIVLFLIVLLLCVGIGLYAVSGLPKPWAKAGPQAYEQLNWRNLQLLAKLVTRARETKPGQQLSWATLGPLSPDLGLDLDRLREESPSGRPFRFLEGSHPVGNIVLVGNQTDALGFTWAVTDGGWVIRVNLTNGEK